MRGHDYDDEPYFVIEQPGSGIGTFLLGLALGAGAALLLAPRSGEEIRERIGARARDLRDSAKQMVDDVSETIQDSLSDARDRMHEQVDDARSAAQSAARRGRRNVRNAVDAGRSAAQEARVELERKLEQQRSLGRHDDPYSEPTA